MSLFLFFQSFSTDHYDAGYCTGDNHEIHCPKVYSGISAAQDYLKGGGN